MKYLMIGVLVLLSNLSFASSIVVGGWSYHQDRNKDYNETHYNLGYQQGGYLLAAYYNSNHNYTIVAGKNNYLYQFGNFRVGYSAGVASGYSLSREFAPFLLPKLSYDYKRIGVDFHVLPSYVYQLQLRYNLNNYEGVVNQDGKFAVSYGYGYYNTTTALHYQMTDTTNLRLYWNGGSERWSDWWEGETSRIHQRETLEFNMKGLVVDYYFYKNFGVYGGVFVNNNHYTTRYLVIHSGQFNVLDTPIEVREGDSLNGMVKWDKFSGTLGLRYGNPFNSERWSWYLDIGASYTSGINGEVSYDFSEYEDSELQELMEDWVKHEEDKYSHYRWIPKLEIGLQYRF